MSAPLLSVVVLNYNARSYIVECLTSIFYARYDNLEVILVDNHSDDGSIAHLMKHLDPQFISRITIVRNERNYGAAVALNQGAAMAHGEYITFVATDTRIERDCFLQLIQVLTGDTTVGAVSAKLLMMQELDHIDSAGEYLNQFGVLMQRHAGCEVDRGQFNQVTEIFSAKGTALTVRAEAFRQAGGYPEDYFMFLEETDLCWRIWLRGYRILFVPDARIYHACGASITAHKRKDYLVKYFGCRNYIRTLWKNLGRWYWLRIVPVHVCMWLGLAFYFMVRFRFKEGWYIVKAVASNCMHPRVLLKQRSAVQRGRCVSDTELMPKVMRPVGFSYLWDRVKMW